MTIPVQSLISITQSDNIIVVSSLPFAPVYQIEDTIEVWLNDDLIDSSTYSWNGAVVTFNPPRILNGYTYIYLVIPVNRLNNFNKGSLFNIKDLNYQFDKLILLLQQINSNSSISLKYYPSNNPTNHDTSVPLLVNNSFFTKINNLVVAKNLEAVNLTSVFAPKKTTSFFLNIPSVTPPSTYVYGSVLDYNVYSGLSVPVPLDGIQHSYIIANKSQSGTSERIGILYYNSPSNTWINTTKGNGICNFSISQRANITTPQYNYYVIIVGILIRSAGNLSYTTGNVNILLPPNPTPIIANNIGSIRILELSNLSFNSTVLFNAPLNSAFYVCIISCPSTLLHVRTIQIQTSGQQSYTLKGVIQNIPANSVITVLAMPLDNTIFFESITFNGEFIFI